MTLQLDMGLASVDVDLYLCFVRCRLTGRDVLEALHQQQSFVAVCQPTLAVGVDFTVLTRLVGLIPCGTICLLKVHQTGWPDAVDGCIEEDDASIVFHAGHFPWCNFSRLVALIDNRIGDDECSVFLVNGESLADSVLHAR